jgi:hypothetical protein
MSRQSTRGLSLLVEGFLTTPYILFGDYSGQEIVPSIEADCASFRNGRRESGARFVVKCMSGTNIQDEHQPE